MIPEKKVLVTGANSYIGGSFAKYICDRQPEHGGPPWQIDRISLRDGSWREASFSGYDAVFHTAGMAHSDIAGVSEETRELYYRVNCDLAEETAKKAREEGVRQFIYMSSVIVYGDSAGVGKQKHITADTKPAPANFYGDSKLRAEGRLQELQTPEFQVAILRAPMIYGRDSRGNFPTLEKLADRLPVFPRVGNCRSVLYVENLAEFVRQLIEKGEGGLFFPQNAEYASTDRLVKLIARAKGGDVRLWRGLNPLVWLVSKLPGKIGAMCVKAFGSLTLDGALSRPEGYSYQIYSLEESIRKIYEDQRDNGCVQQ